MTSKPRTVSAEAEELDPSVESFRRVLILAQQLRYLFDQRLADDDLTTAQAMVLTVVAVIGSPSFSEIAAALATSHQNVAKLAESLRRKGFVTIEPDPDDRRIRRVRVTEQSREFWAQRDPGDFAFVQGLFGELSSPELATLVALLRRAQESVERSYWEARPR